MSDAARMRVDLDVSGGRDRTPAAPRPDDPFRIAIMGNLRGRTDANSSEPLSGRTGLPVDRDDLDSVLARLSPRLSLPMREGMEVDLTFSEMEDFHPDRLFQRAPFFRALREARARLADAETFSSTLDSIIGGTTAAGESPGPRVDADDVVADTLSGSLLERMVDPEPARQDPLRAYLRQIVAPHIVPGEDPRRAALLQDVDSAIAESMCAVLHHPRFQELEALWRGVEFLVRRIETNSSLKVYLIDATQAELRADLTGTGDPARGALARVLERTSPDGAWSVLVMDHWFGPSEDDLVLLYALSALAAHLGAAALSGARPDLVGLESFSVRLPDATHVKEWQHDAWHAFRRTSAAGSIGLALPRFLLRVPYGEEGEPCDVLRFEEMDTPPDHEHYLWGNSAFAVALLLAESFEREGWRLQPGRTTDVSRLPVHTWRSNGEFEIQPCAECLMSDRLGDALMTAGPMVLATIKHGDTARLIRLQSLASPLRALQGPWSRI